MRLSPRALQEGHPQPIWSPARAILLVLALEAALVLVDLRLGPWTVVGFEEDRNARAALLVACGHVDRLAELRYRDFCGGCTAEALVGAPLLRLFGAEVQVWKLVPALFHLGTTAAGAALAARAAGAAGALAFGALMAGAPWAYRELALTGWGNHVESGAFTLGALALTLAAQRGGARGLALGVAGGLLAGLGLSFCATAAWALPALAVAAGRRPASGGEPLAPRLGPRLGLLRGPRLGLLLGLLLGLPLGLLPALWWYGPRPAAAAGEWARLGAVAPADPAALLAWVGPDLLPGRLWPSGGSAYVILLLGLALIGVVQGGRGARVAGAGLLFLGLAWALRADLWADTPPLAGLDPFGWRYRAPAWPLLLWAAASLAGRRRAWLPIGALAAFGLGWRVIAWSGGPAPGWGLPLGVPDGSPEPSVPEGDPPTRRARAMGRPQDLAAAAAFAEAHADPLPACRALHLGELGRRAGLGLPAVELGPLLADLGPADRLAVARGLAGGIAPGGAPPDPARAAAAAPLAEARPGLRPALDLRTPGSCAARLRAWLDAESDGGARFPAGGSAPPCDDPAALGRLAADTLGCGPRAAAALGAASAALEAACPR